MGALAREETIMGVSSITFKASALFLGFFGPQFALAQDFLMSENFQDGSYKLDEWHRFIMRGTGCAFCPIGGFLWKLSGEADKHMLFSLLTFTMTSCALPFYAQMKLPVNMPKHLIPVVGCALLIAAHLFCLVSPGKPTKSKK